VTVFTVRVGKHNFIVLTYLLTCIRGPCAAWTSLSGKIIVPDASTLPSNCVFNFRFLAPVVSEIIWGGPKFALRGLASPEPPSGKTLTYPQVLAYTYITVKFQLRSSINVRLTESSVYNRPLDRGAPVTFVHLLKNWYGNLCCRVRWNNVLGEPFVVKCGVRQGGVLSPYLFAIYILTILLLSQSNLAMAFILNSSLSDEIVMLMILPCCLLHVIGYKS